MKSIPSSSPPLDAFAAELRSCIEGEVRFDSLSRILYSTDASIYQIVPLGVVVPRHAQDVVETVRLAARHRLPLLPRGSGTSLAGQTVGEAIVLDFTPHMREVLELNVEERWVRVQPGIVLDELNRFLRPHGLMFAPDVATSNRASIGGMMGNNSSGAHSILYGKTVDHVLEQRVVLADGSMAHFAELSEEEWRRRAADDTLEGRIYREVSRIVAEYGEEVEARFPRIMRRVGGYNLDELVRRGRRNLAALTVGSEGTLATVVEAKLQLVPAPRCTALLVSHFDDLVAALEAVPEILPHAPAAVELIDRLILDLTRGHPQLAAARTFLEGEPDALLVTEFYGDSAEEVAGRVEALRAALRARRLGTAHVPRLSAREQQDVWRVRKAGLGLLMGMKGDAKPVGFIEDTAVAPERLAAYIGELRALLRERNLQACFYAHASVGCIHVRPVFSLKAPDGPRRMREVATEVAELVLRYGGALSAEHGDGLARSEFQERMFGPRLYRAFRELKAAFDPHGRMNPGKIVEAPPMHENLRIPATLGQPVPTVLDFSADGGMARAVELCSGVGACRKRFEGSMCPSYRATLDEAHSTRGRANMLRMALSGTLGPEGLADPRVREVLDLCLECKACKSECPSQVDLAKLKYEVLAQVRARRPFGSVPLRDRLFGEIAGFSRLASAAAPLVNAVQEWPAVRLLLDRWLGVDRRRRLPALAARTFQTRWRERSAAATTGARAAAGGRGEVLLFIDTFTNYYEPEVGEAAVRLLEAFGYRVRIPETECCGRPLLSKGMLPEARALAERNVAELAAEARRGVPLVGLEPSCIATLRDEYRELRLGDAAEAVAREARLLEAFLAERHAGEPLPFRHLPAKLRFHAHCHQRAVLDPTATLAALRLPPGFEVEEIPSGCCGMAGSFGYEKEHYDLSLRIAEQSLGAHLRDLPEDVWIVASGASCRRQIEDVFGRKALHPVQALACALAEEAV